MNRNSLTQACCRFGQNGTGFLLASLSHKSEGKLSIRRDEFYPMARRYHRPTRLALAVVVSAGASACANLASLEGKPLPGGPQSPVAVAANEALNNPGPWPTFATVPKVSAKPVVAVPTLGVSQAAVNAEADAFMREIAALPPLDPEAAEIYAARQRQVFDNQTAPAEDAAARADALARELRARATPPPPPK
jgi:hypothetical protein